MSRPEYLTGAKLVFEGGSLNLDFRKRRGNFAFTDEQLEPVREYEGGGVWDGFLVKLPNSELEAIRDFLNKWLPPAESGAGVCQGSEADTAQGNLPPDDPLDTSRHVDGTGDLRNIAERVSADIARLEDCAGYAAHFGTPRARDSRRWNRDFAADLRALLAALAQPSPLDTSGRVEGDSSSAHPAASGASDQTAGDAQCQSEGGAS